MNQQRKTFNPKFIMYAFLGFFGLMLIMMITGSIFVTLNPGESGVLFRKFGGGLEKEKIYEQGFHVIAPWNTLYVYDTRIKENFEKMEVLSKNGLEITVDMSYRYHPVKSKIGFIQEEIGKNFHESILLPEIRSATRKVIGKYLPEELYSSKRETIQDEIFTSTRDMVVTKYLDLDAVLIREVGLPENLQRAIERKLEQEQSSLEYEFRLTKERKEAQRRIIEAQAKADANKILNASLSENILRDKGIEATLELANSPNSKVIIVGGQDGGLPLILNN